MNQKQKLLDSIPYSCNMEIGIDEYSTKKEIEDFINSFSYYITEIPSFDISDLNTNCGVIRVMKYFDGTFYNQDPITCPNCKNNDGYCYIDDRYEDDVDTIYQDTILSCYYCGTIIQKNDKDGVKYHPDFDFWELPIC